jgi:hypothetical protein
MHNSGVGTMAKLNCVPRMIEIDPLVGHVAKATAAFHDLAIRDFNHRMANTLCLLIAGLRHDFAQVTNPELKAALGRHEEQIACIGELHRLLVAEAGPEKCAIASYFQPLCNALACAVLAPPGRKMRGLSGRGNATGRTMQKACAHNLRTSHECSETCLSQQHGGKRQDRHPS